MSRGTQVFCKQPATQLSAYLQQLSGVSHTEQHSIVQTCVWHVGQGMRSVSLTLRVDESD